MNKTHIKSYWRKVRQRAWAEAINKSGMKLIIPALAVLIVAIGLGGIPVSLGIMKYSFFNDNLVANTLTGLSQILVSLIALLISFFVFLREMPPKMYEELGGFIENPFDLEEYQSKKERKEDDDKWASILVKNISPSENIEECFLKLIDIVDSQTGKSIIEDIQNLTWSGREQNKEISGNQPIKIVASHNAVCDVARTNKENIWGDKVYYTTWFGGQKITPGKYLLRIVIYGNFKNHPIHYTYQTVLHFDQPDKFKLDKPVLIEE